MNIAPLVGLPADANPPCSGRYELFDSVDTEAHFKARALCNTCPVLDACEQQRREVARSAYSTYGPRGTWAGKLYGAPFLNVTKRPLDELEDRYDEDEARRAALAYQRGDKSEWALLGRRVYERRNRRAREARKRGEAA